MSNRNTQAGELPALATSYRAVYLDRKGLPQVLTMQSTNVEPIPPADIRRGVEAMFKATGGELLSLQAIIQDRLPLVIEPEEEAPPVRPRLQLIRGGRYG